MNTYLHIFSEILPMYMGAIPCMGVLFQYNSIEVVIQNSTALILKRHIVV